MASAVSRLPYHRRSIIEAEIEAHLQRVQLLIARLDRADAATEDLEDDDPAGDPLDDGEDEDWRPEGFRLPLPVYGLDQTDGPINHRAAERAWHKHLMGM